MLILKNNESGDAHCNIVIVHTECGLVKYN